MIDLSLCKCDECPLKDISRPIVPDCKDSATTVFVGIAPAIEEIKKREFFVGQSGKLLKAVATSLGYADVAFTNAMLCYYPSDLSDSQIELACQCCFPRLVKEIWDLNPKLIVALGNIPLKAIVDTHKNIMDLDGRVLESKLGPMLATIHPASILRRPEAFLDFKESLRSGIRFLEGRYQQVSLSPKTVIADESNIAEICQIAANAEDLVIDIETTGTGFYPYGVNPDKIRCVVLNTGDNTAYIVPAESSPYYPAHPNYLKHEGLRQILESKSGIYHNGQFDCGFFWQEGLKTKIKYDTFLAHYLTDEREYTHGLKRLGQRMLGAPDWEEGLKAYLPNKKSSYDLIPDDKLYEYAAFDVLCTYSLYRQFSQELDYKILKDLVIPCTNMFVDLRHTGIRIDIGVLMEMDELLDEEIENQTKELRELVGYYINPSSTQEVAELLYDTLKITPLRTFGRSTSAKALNNLPEDPILSKIIEIRQLKKLQSTYLIGMSKFVDKERRIHPFLKLFASVTGRLGAEDPSVLNVVHNEKIRGMYLPEDGCMILEADQKQMELRWYSILSGDESMKNLLLNTDPHETIQLHIKDVTGKLYDRVKTKTGVFGRVYKRGIGSFMTGFHTDKAGALKIIEAIENLAPKLTEFHSTVEKEIKSKGYLTSHFGRKRRFGLLTRDNWDEVFRQGINFPIQSAATDTNLYCMLHLYRNRKKLGVLPHWPIHDSNIMSIEDPTPTHILEVIHEIEQFSEELVEGKMKFTVEGKVGETWGSTKQLCHRCARPIVGKGKKVKGVEHCTECAEILNRG